MILQRIVREKKQHLAGVKKDWPREILEEMLPSVPPCRDFRKTLMEKSGRAIIAEIKRASPSRGTIFAEQEPGKRALVYQESGAAAISVLTEEKYFQGSLADLKIIKEEVSIPVLRKDFILDSYQLLESRCYGADAVLLIASLLDSYTLGRLIQQAEELGLAPLVEIHTLEELKKAIYCGATTIGVNNRDLKTFKTDLEVTFRLCPRVPPGAVLVSESGIRTPEDIRRLRERGVDAFLVGEVLMTHSSPGQKIRELLAS